MPDEIDVCGVLCKPITIWHSLVLRRVGCAFFSDQDPTMDDCALLLAHCSGGIQHGRRYYNSEGYRELINRRIFKRLRKAGTKRAIDACADYVASSLRTPGHTEWTGKGNGEYRSINSPIEYVLLHFLCAGNPDKMVAAWDTPYATARCMYDATREISGNDDTVISEKREYSTDKILGVA